MSIISLDGELDIAPFERSTSIVHLSHKTRKSLIRFGPSTFCQKWKVPKNGFYTPTDVRLVITPHISERAGVEAVVRLLDESDMSPSRILFQSKQFNLGHGMTLEGSQLPFCLPIGEYPITFEVMVLRSQFQETRTMFSTSLEWQMMWSSTPLSRVESVFAVAQVPVAQANPMFRSIKCPSNKSRGPRAKAKIAGDRKLAADGVGTTPGLVTGDCVGPSCRQASNCLKLT